MSIRSLLAFPVAVICVLAALSFTGCGGGGGGGGGDSAPPAAAVVQQPAYVLPTFAETSQLRDQIGRQVDWGSAEAQLGDRIFTNDPEAIAAMFREDAGAVMCGGAAYFLHLRYLEAGYRSFIIGFETEGVDGHTVALVEIQREDGTKALIVQDPSFNLSYTDASGKPLSIFEMLTALAELRHQEIVVQHGEAAEVEFLMPKGRPTPKLGGGSYITSAVPLPSDNPLFDVYPATVNIAEYNATLAPKIAAYTAANGLPNDPLYTMFNRLSYVDKRFPMSDADAAEAAELFDAIKAHQAALNR